MAVFALLLLAELLMPDLAAAADMRVAAVEFAYIAPATIAITHLLNLFLQLHLALPPVIAAEVPEIFVAAMVLVAVEQNFYSFFPLGQLPHLYRLTQLCWLNADLHQY